MSKNDDVYSTSASVNKTSPAGVQNLPLPTPEQFQLGMSAAKMGIWHLKVDTQEVTWIGDVESVFGIPKGTFGGTLNSYLEFIHPEDLEHANSCIEKALKDPNFEYIVEHRIIWPDHTIHWVYAKGMVFWDESGQPTEMTGTVHDITAQKTSQQALQRSEERYRSFMAQSTEGIFRIELEQPIALDLPEEEQVELLYQYCYLAEVNRHFSEIYGIDDPAKMIGARAEYFFPKDNPASRALVLEMVRSRYQLNDWKTEERDEAGKEIVILNNIIGIIEKNHLVRMWGVRREITDRFLLDETLREIAKGVSSQVGESFFDSLVEHLSKALGATYAFVGQLKEGKARSVQAIAAFAKGLAAPTFEYELSGTPCENVVGEKLCSYSDGIQTRFPKDQLLVDMGVEGYVGAPLFEANGAPNGLLVVLFESPIVNLERCVSMLKIFASRASAELERIKSDVKNKALEDRLRKKLEGENEYLRQEVQAFQPFGEIVGESAGIQEVIKQINLVAPTDATALILGETGTGKELIARAIHMRSKRKGKPFIKVSCGAIPAELFESEFFGHIKGAFTGAVKDRLGRFLLADGGTIFLDEVGEIPLGSQSKLLRVLQEGTFEAVGSSETIKVDVRVVAATHQDLKNESTFREDLYYRLSVFPLHNPTLRSRKDDIPALAGHFMAVARKQFGVAPQPLTSGVLKQLQAYDFPGNVRELRNILERAVILSKGGALSVDLTLESASGEANGRDRARSEMEGNARERPERDEAMLDGPPRTMAVAAGAEPLQEAQLKDYQRQRILDALERTNWKISGPGGAAELLGMKPTTLSSRVKRMGLKKNERGR